MRESILPDDIILVSRKDFTPGPGTPGRKRQTTCGSAPVRLLPAMNRASGIIVIHWTQILEDRGDCRYVFVRLGHGESVVAVDGPGPAVSVPS